MNAIISPKRNDRVLHVQIVSGTAEPGKTYWLVVQPLSAPSYHPQPEQITPGSDGKWSASAYFGESPTKNVGEGFRLIMVVVDDDAKRQFHDYLNGAPALRYPGMPYLAGELVAEVTVFRR